MCYRLEIVKSMSIILTARDTEEKSERYQGETGTQTGGRERERERERERL